MKTWTKKIGQLVIALCLATSFVSASTIEQNSTQNLRTPTGLRIMSDEERSGIEKEYAEVEMDEEEIQVQERFGRNSFYPIDFSQFIVNAIGYKGSSVILSDGSVWTVRPQDGIIAQNWQDQNTANYSGKNPSKVFVTSNDNWFFDKDYLYRIVNMETGQFIYCNMSQSPFQTSSAWILNLNIEEGFVELTDSNGGYVLMYLSPSSKLYFSKWQINDRVLFGRNLRWGSSYNPYLLINIETLTNAACDL